MEQILIITVKYIKRVFLCVLRGKFEQMLLSARRLSLFPYKQTGITQELLVMFNLFSFKGF